MALFYLMWLTRNMLYHSSTGNYRDIVLTNLWKIRKENFFPRCAGASSFGRYSKMPKTQTKNCSRLVYFQNFITINILKHIFTVGNFKRLVLCLEYLLFFIEKCAPGHTSVADDMRSIRTERRWFFLISDFFYFFRNCF